MHPSAITEDVGQRIIWHGTGAEGRALADAINHNCSCQYDAAGARIQTCAPHSMLAGDQKSLDALVFVYRTRRWYVEGEYLQEHEHAHLSS